MRVFLLASLWLIAPAAIPAAIFVGPEPSLEDVLIDEYGSLAELTEVTDREIWFQQALPTQVGIRVLAKFSDAFQRFGICQICDGSDTTFTDEMLTSNGANLDRVLMIGGEPLFDIPLGGVGFINTSSDAPLALVGSVHSVRSFNSGENRHFRSFLVDSSKAMVFAIEDWLNEEPFDPPGDGDFNDLIVEVSGIQDSDPNIVPEPSTISLFAGGALVALILRRRRARRTSS